MSEYIKKTLQELMDDELSQMNLPSEFGTLKSFINDGKKSAEFIRYILEDKPYNILKNSSPLYETSELRARHSAVTFLLGLVFKKFGDLFTSIPSIININYDIEQAQNMWLITSLYHDKAYSSKHLKDPAFDIRKKFSPFLLEDEFQDNLSPLYEYSIRYPKTLAYTYEEILSYDEYAIEYHRAKNNDAEKRDHGILGGVMMFSDLAKKAEKSGRSNELPIIKACSLAVAQHNIFKSPKGESDANYPKQLSKLLSTSSFKITQNEPLLLFLSLIDTIECVKKLSKGRNVDKYLESLTVLKSISVSVQCDCIEIDYSALKKEVLSKNDKELEEVFDSYLDTVSALNTWTTFLTKFDSSNPCQCKITLDSEASLCPKAYDYAMER